MNHPFRRQRVAMEPALALQPTVLRDGGQYAIFVALLRQPCWCGDGCTRAAAGGIWEAIWGTQTEGKIKGPARMCPPSQSARGLGTARCREHAVPCRGWIRPATCSRPVLIPTHCAWVRWSGRHGRT